MCALFIQADLSSLGAQAILLILSCAGSYMMLQENNG